MKTGNSGFNPYPYQPLLNYFYDGGPVPASAGASVDHVRSVWSFAEWMRDNFPDVFALVSQTRPDLLEPGVVVASGALAPSGSGLAGLSEVVNASDPVTDWGKQLLDLAKTYLQVDTQRDLLKANISLAERGLPPINSASLAPQVNFGLSSDMQKLAMFGVAGLVVAGLVSAFRKR